LRTDFIDLYQLHGPRGVHDDVLALMNDFRSEGKIRGFGVGLESSQYGVEWIETGLLSAIQVGFGLLDPQAADQVIPRAAAIQLPVIVRGVFAGGFVARPQGSDWQQLRPGQPARLDGLCRLASSANVSAMQLAIWYVVAQPGVSTVLVGASSAAHLREVARYVETPPPAPELLSLMRLLEETPELRPVTGATSPGGPA
jgi:D-threo-aldose 1-dehydrogenase